MIETKEYHRPSDLSEAIGLLQREDRVTVPLAGGSWLVPRLRPGVADSVADVVDAVVDLAELSLNHINKEGDYLQLGATTTLTNLAEDTACQELADGLLARAARQEGPINLRNVATVGGCVARAQSESELVLALLALRSEVRIDGGRETTLSLADFLANPSAAIDHGLITGLRVPWSQNLRGGLAHIVRTPADSPIVAAVAVSDGTTARIALGGVAAKPILIELSTSDSLDSALPQAIDQDDVPADFRGSAAYRTAMAAVLVRRALEQAQR